MLTFIYAHNSLRRERKRLKVCYDIFYAVASHRLESVGEPIMVKRLILLCCDKERVERVHGGNYNKKVFTPKLLG